MAKDLAPFCSVGVADPAVGVDSDLFRKLVDDRFDAGCYCFDAELTDILKELNPSAGEISSRGSLVSTVFQAREQRWAWTVARGRDAVFCEAHWLSC